MANLRPAVAVIERTAPIPREHGKRIAWGWTCAVICGALLYVAFFLYYASRLLAAWRTGDAPSWDSFWYNPLYFLFFYPVMLLAQPGLLDSSFARWDRLAVAYRTALEDDSAHVPLATPQPTPDASDSSPNACRSIAPLARPHRTREEIAFTIAMCLFGAALCVVLGVFVVFLTWISNCSGGLALRV